MRSSYPFDVFGLEDNADEKSIKRAYAALVRQHRPDKDPKGFARVQAAYETALGIRQAQGWSDIEGNDADFSESFAPDEAPRARPMDRPEPPEHRDFDFDAELEFAPPGTLEELVARVGVAHAARLVNEATDELLLGGHADHLSKELCSDAADRMLLATPSIEPALLKTAACLAFSAPHDAGRLLDRVELGGGSYRSLENRALWALTFADAFEEADGRSLPAELYRLVTLLPLVDETSSLELIDAALSFARQRPEELAKRLDRLPRGLLEGIGASALASDEDEDEDENEPAKGDRSSGDATIGALLGRLDRDMDQDRMNSIWTWSLVGAAVVAGALWRQLGTYGAILGGILFVLVLAVPQGRMDARLYAVYVRLPLLRFVLQSGMSPEELASAMKRYSVTKDIRRFIDEVREDRLLDLAHRLVVGARRRRRAQR